MERTKHKAKKVSEPLDNGRSILSKGIFIKLLEYKNPDVIALYSFYRNTTIWQKTNQVRATNLFCRKGIGLGQDRFTHAKEILTKLGLIEQLGGVRGDNGKFTKAYIKVNYKWRDDYSRDTVSSTSGKNKGDQATSRDTGFPLPAKHNTNALKKHKINAYENIYTAFENEFSKAQREDKQLISTIKRYIKYRQDKNLSTDLPLIKNLAKRFAGIGTSTEATASMDEAIKKGWSGVNKVTSQKINKLESFTFSGDNYYQQPDKRWKAVSNGFCGQVNRWLTNEEAQKIIEAQRSRKPNTVYKKT